MSTVFVLVNKDSKFVLSQYPHDDNDTAIREAQETSVIFHSPRAIVAFGNDDEFLGAWQDGKRIA